MINTHTFTRLAACGAIAIGAASLRASTVVVNTHETFQTMDGFGACIVVYDFHPEYADPAFYDRAVFDMGLSILRLPVGGVERLANDNDDPATFNWDAYDRKDLEFTMDIAQQFQARGIRKTFITPWTPPQWMKTNRSAVVGGRLRPDMRDEYAEYLSAVIEGADKFFGVKIDGISIQNELLFVEPYESCVYNPLQLRETVRAVKRKFAKEGIDADIILPEDMGIPERIAQYVEPVLADPETRTFKGILASHGGNGFENWQQMAATLRQFNRTFWMTETSGQNDDWQGGLSLAQNMHDTIAGGNASAFIYWQFSGPEGGRFALFKAGDFTPKAQAARHFTRFVRPGAQRIYAGGDTNGVLVSAYKQPDTGDVTVVLINKTGASAAIDVQLSADSAPGNWLVFTSTSGSYMQQSSASTTESVAVPADGIVTLFGRCGESLDALPSLKPEGWTRPELGKALKPDPEHAVDQRLHAAARANDVELVNKLLAEGLDPNALNVGGLSPLHRAAYPGFVEVVNPLIAGGANPNVKDSTGGPPLLIAARNGHDAFVSAIAAAGADVNLADNSGVTALDLAALGGHPSTVKTLLKLGANPNQADEHGWTALHWAAASPSRSSLEVLKVLVEAGANAKAVDADKQTPLHTAAANLIDPGLFARRANHGVIYINAERLRVLVDAGADVNARDKHARTPLHWAAWLGETVHGEDVAGVPFTEYRTEAIRYLLAAGAESAPEDDAGKTPADYATSEGYADAASVLNTVGSLPWLAGKPPVPGAALKFAAPAPRPAAQMDFRLMRAAASGDLAGVKQALAAGADPNISRQGGGTPLHAAVIGGHLEVVKALLEAGADVTRRDSDGYTPIERADQNSQTEIGNALRAAKDAKPASP